MISSWHLTLCFRRQFCCFSFKSLYSVLAHAAPHLRVSVVQLCRWHLHLTVSSNILVIRTQVKGRWNQSEIASTTICWAVVSTLSQVGRFEANTGTLTGKGRQTFSIGSQHHVLLIVNRVDARTKWNSLRWHHCKKGITKSRLLTNQHYEVLYKSSERCCWSCVLIVHPLFLPKELTVSASRFSASTGLLGFATWSRPLPCRNLSYLVEPKQAHNLDANASNLDNHGTCRANQRIVC